MTEEVQVARKRRSRRSRVRRIRRMMNLRALTLWLVWLGGAGAAVVLLSDSPGLTMVPAVVESVDFNVAAPEVGRVLDVTVKPGERVRKGEALVALDPSDVSAELQVLAAELEQAQAELAARAGAIGRERLEEERAFATAVEIADTELLQARIAVERDRAELSGIRSNIRRWRGMVDAKVAPSDRLAELRIEKSTVERRLSAGRTSIEALEQRVAQARERLERFRESAPADPDGDAVERELQPLKTAVRVARARLTALQRRRALLTLTAPSDGVIHRVFCRPGDVVTAGAPAVIVRSDEARRVVAYLDAGHVRSVAPGSGATVAMRDGSGRRLSGRIASMGAGLTPLPEPLQTTPGVRRFGREVFVLLDERVGLDRLGLYPGQLLYVQFDSPGGLFDSAAIASHPEPTAANVDIDKGLRTLVVSHELRAKTRLEPSSLLWSPKRGSFLMASDDTGWPDANEHAPWLFEISADGRIADEPLPVEGVSAINDAECMARGDDGAFWVLSSNSRSRKGKRPTARTNLLRVVETEWGLRSTGSVSFHQALATAARNEPALLGRLGVADARENSQIAPRLDIEGMIWREGDLYLGLKAPLDEQGNAMIWRLKDPEAFVKSGSLRPGQLERFASVNINVAGSRGGISGIEWDPAGGWLVLGVFEGDGVRDMAGGLYSIPVPGQGDVLTARALEEFAGEKPEGLALVPGASSATVVFDRGNATPAWTKVSLKP